ncbi:MAG: hypothetical protein U5R14_13875 [Gemmatimonadota bacterium]|nr:hypothetical protein [Gemmatimonadota bacterium]
MRTGLLALALVIAGSFPQAATAQALGVAARGGTLGLGAEAAIPLGNRLVVRGGIGLLPFEIDGTLDGIDLTLELPERWSNIGLDLYLNEVMRLGGGFLFKSDDVTLRATPAAPQDLGGRTFTPEEIGTLTGVLESENRAPYILVGFGKHTSSGIGLSLDLGVAFMNDTRVSLDAEEGTLVDDPEFRERLDAEARSFEEDLPRYMEIWPILSLGLRVGLGG